MVFKYGCVIGLCGMLFSGAAWCDDTNTVNYEGTLFNLACVIDEEIPVFVDMGTITDKQLYKNGHSVAKNFTLTLKNCDPALANSVKITLNGTAVSVTPDGYLAFDASSVAKGAVISISDDSLSRGHIPMGSPLPAKPIESGTMRIPLYASVVATPEALENQSLVPGSFTATLYYLVEFE
ncbi:fimbrial protein [Providencia rettgeri]|uniref:fimbrial protein n=1 Tax=Providencia rettgeri TaxID=587 RepID=UPI0034E0C683